MFDLVSPTSPNVGSNGSIRIDDLNEQEAIDTLQREIEIHENDYVNLSEKASKVRSNSDPRQVQDFFNEVKQESQHVENTIGTIRKFYHPLREVVELFAKLYELYAQNLRDLNDRYAKPCQNVQNLLNKLMSSLSSKEQLSQKDRDLIAELQGMKLNLPISHPGMETDNGFTIEFPETEDVEVLRSAASRFYGQCESAMQRLFINIQKLFNDQVNMFELAKDGLKNNLSQKIVQKTGDQR